MESVDVFLQRLIELWPPDSARHHNGAMLGFASVESELGLALPTAFKELTHTYGQGVWFDTIYVLNPFVGWVSQVEPWHCRRLGLTGGPVWCKRMKKVRKKYPEDFSLYPIYPEPGGIFPRAFVTGGGVGVLHWLTEGLADKWTSLFDPPEPQRNWEVAKMSVTELLWKLAIGDSSVTSTALYRTVAQFRSTVFTALP